jgi:Uma2 family endonuclease
MPVLQTPARPSLRVTWEPLPEDFVLPDDPVENLHQPPLAAALTDALGAAQRLRPEMLVGSNFGLVATLAGSTVVKAPDWFYVPRAQPVEGLRRSYTPHLQGDRVAVVMEFLSSEDNGELSLRATPPYGKLFFYEQILQVPTYAIYDPRTGTLEVRRLAEERYALQPPDAAGRFWIPELELFLGIWHGDRLAQTLDWLRWWDADGHLLLWSSEQAEQERQRAEQEHQRAEQEHQRAEQERQRAERERQRAERLAELLRAQGLDPDLE